MEDEIVESTLDGAIDHLEAAFSRALDAARMNDCADILYALTYLKHERGDDA